MALEFIQHLDLPVKWHFGTQANFNALKDVDPMGLYFITDTGALYRGKTLYNPSVVLYETRPSRGATGRLYINRINLEGYVYTDNKGWVKVIDAVTDDDVSDGNIENILRISGTEVKRYADGIFRDMSKSAYTDIVYNEENNTISFIKNGVGIPTPLNGIVKGMEFDLNTRILTMTDAAGTTLATAHIPDLYVVGGSYDDNEKAIILKLIDGQSIRFKAYNLLHLFDAKETATINTVMENYIDGKNVISAHVKFSNDLYNILEAKEDGIYSSGPVDLSKMEEGELYKVTDEGYIVPTGVNINVLATEAYVAQMKEDCIAYINSLDSIYLRVADVLVESFNDVAISSQVPSFYLVNKTCGLKRINQQRRR